MTTEATTNGTAPATREAPAPARAADKLLALLDQVTQADLVELEMEIEEQESRLDGLRSLRKLIETRLGVQAERKASRRPAAPAEEPAADSEPDNPLRAHRKHGPLPSPETMTRRRNIAILLDRSGCMSCPVIARYLKLEDAKVRLALDYPWFERKPNGGYDLTEIGRQEGLEKGRE